MNSIKNKPINMNIIMGLVYLGASVLIIVVGLRGLGKTVGELAFIPSMFVDSKGYLSANLVMLAILLEFCMLILLSVATMIQKDTSTPVHVNKPNSNFDISNFREELSKLKDVAREEKMVIDEYLSEFEKIADKINRIQYKNMQALKGLKDEVSR